MFRRVCTGAPQVDQYLWLRRGYLELTEAALEDAFAEYQQRQGQRASAARRKRRRLGMATELDGTGSQSEDDEAVGDGGGFAALPAADDGEVLLPIMMQLLWFNRDWPGDSDCPCMSIRLLCQQS